MDMECAVVITAEMPNTLPIPTVAANLATALTQLVPKDVRGEDSDGAQLVEAVHHHHGPQGALESVMATTKVSLDRVTCIESLDKLITRLSTLSDRSSGISPGFDCCIDNALPWKQIGGFPQYETLDAVNATRGLIPLPNADSAIELFQLVKLAWQVRLEYESRDNKEERDSYCSCIGHWTPNQNVLKQICNQVFEQVMTREASACLRKQPAITRIWNEAYSPDTCPHPDTMECLYIDSMIRLLTKETYLHAYILAAAATTTSSIDISICYLFYTDPKAKYILLDLLPYVAARGVKVRILFELAILESQCLQMPLDASSNIGHESPLNLPEGSPPYVRGAKKFRSATELVREFLNLTSGTPTVECRYWFARDKSCGK